MAVFELGEPGGAAAAIRELAVGPWAPAPPGPVAFEAGADRAASLWRVDLARDGAVRRAALDGGERSVARTHALLDGVPRRLERALGRAAAVAGRRGAALDGRGATPGDHGAAGPVLAADGSLIAALTGAATPAPNAEPMAWSGSPGPPTAAASSGEDAGRVEQLLDQVVDLARGRARIETRIAGALVAHSITTLSGDTELWIAPRLSVTEARLHARSVAIAVRTRHAWARILTLIARGAGRLVALGLPAGGLAALPLVWAFLRDVLREVRWPG